MTSSTSATAKRGINVLQFFGKDRSTSASLPSSHAQQAPVVSKDETLDFRTRQPCLDRFWSCQESGYPVSSMLQPISRQEDGRSDCSVESLPSDSGRGGSDDDVSHCNGRSAVSSNDNRCLDSYHVPCQRGKPCLEHVRSYNGATVGSRENARNINQKHVTFKDTSFCNKNVKSCHSSKTTNIDDKVKPNMADPTTIETDNEADIEDTLSRQNGGHFDESIMKEAIVLEYSPTLMNNIPSYTKASDFFDKFEDDKRDTKLKTTGINFVMRTEIVTCENESFLSHSLNTAAATSDHGSPISLHSQPILSFVSQSSDSDVQTVSKTDRLINHNVACRPFSAVSPKQISSQPQHANNVSAFGKIETLHLSSRTNTGQPTDRMFNALNGEYGKCKMLHSSTGKGLEDRGLMMHNSSSDLLDNIPSYDDPLAIHSPQWTDIIV